MSGRTLRIALWTAGTALLCAFTASAQDNVEGPWGTVNGDVFGRSRSATLTMPFRPGAGAREAWRLSTTAHGSSRAGGIGSIVFDAAGNLYWKTNQVKLSSASPAGAFRWNAKDGAGADQAFGGFTNSSPVVGGAAVYAASGLAAPPFMGAWNKTTGARIWLTSLPAESWNSQSQATPVLYNGKLYVLGQSNGVNANIYQINASNGTIDWSSSIDLIYPVNGAMTLVPNIFGAGKHGLYFNTDSGSGTDGFGEVYGVRIDTSANAATLEWQVDGGKVARSHVIYSPVTGRLYTATWNDYGSSIYAYNPLTGATYASANIGYGHGFYDACMLDWDDRTVIAGGFDGRMARYTDNGNGAFTSTDYPFTNWFGEYRVLGQLLQDCGTGHSIVVTGTNSRSDLGAGHDARCVVMDLDLASSGPFDDGPLYLDDLQVFDGASLIYSTNFDAFSTGVLAGQGGWVHDNAAPSGNDATNPVVVANDPTGSGMGKVAVFNAAGTGGGWQGVFHDFASTSNTTATVKWKQWRADVTDNIWFAFGNSPNDFNDLNGWGIAWDTDHKIHPWHFDDDGSGGGPVTQTAGVWQQVTIAYDFNALTCTVTIDGVAGAPIPMAAFFWDGIDLQMEGTALSTFANKAQVEFPTGVVNDNGYTLHGGPLIGPDGKIYYLHRVTSELVALEPNCVGADTNCDGSVNQFDIQPFVNVLSHQASPCSACAADTNGDGSVNQFDIQGFVEFVSHVCP